MLGIVVAKSKSAGWNECSVWLWQREAGQDGVSAEYGCDRERRM